MSQKEISTILEVSQTIYGKWESDIFYPTYKNLKKIAAFYMIDVVSLVEDKENLKSEEKSNFNRGIPKSKTMFKLLKKIEKVMFLIREQIGNQEERKEK